MEQCYNCYAESGFNDTGIKLLAQYCGCTSPNLYVYFKNPDDLIIQSTAYCMSKVEEDFMAKAPQKSAAELDRVISKFPYSTAEKHGKKYQLMYQIYTTPNITNMAGNFSPTSTGAMQNAPGRSKARRASPISN